MIDVADAVVLRKADSLLSHNFEYLSLVRGDVQRELGDYFNHDRSPLCRFASRTSVLAGR